MAIALVEIRNITANKLVSLCTLEGIPVAYELEPANTDERLAAESVSNALRGCRIYANKGFIGED